MTRIASVTGTGGTTGLEDPLIGFKWKFLNGVYTGKTRRPDMGVEVVTTVPAGSSAFRVNASQPSAKFLVQYNTDPNTTEFFNVIVSSLGAGRGQFYQYALSGGVSYNVNPLTAPFIEVYALMPNIRGGPSSEFMDIGTTYLLTQRWQVDVRYGTAFNPGRDGYFTGAGLSYRF